MTTRPTRATEIARVTFPVGTYDLDAHGQNCAICLNLLTTQKLLFQTSDLDAHYQNIAICLEPTQKLAQPGDADDLLHHAVKTRLCDHVFGCVSLDPYIHHMASRPCDLSLLTRVSPQDEMYHYLATDARQLPNLPQKDYTVPQNSAFICNCLKSRSRSHILVAQRAETLARRPEIWHYRSGWQACQILGSEIQPRWSS